MIVSQEKIKEFIKEQHAIDGMVSIHDFELWLEEQPRVGEWIPCSERLPELRKDCLVTVKYSGFMGMHGIWIKTGHMEKEGVWRGDCCGGEVTAWMPLPPAYKEGE